MSDKLDPGFLSDDSFDEFIATQGEVLNALFEDSRSTINNNQFHKPTSPIQPHAGSSTTSSNAGSPSILAPCQWDSDDSVVDPNYEPNETFPIENNGTTPSIHSKRPRHKRKQPEKWKSNLRKQKRNAGLDYLDSKGRAHYKKTMRPGCSDKCLLKCHENIPGHGRQVLFNEYWALGSYLPQRMFIAARVTKKAKKSTRTSAEVSRRQYTYTYTLEYQNNVLRVCKKFFLDTLGISEKTVRITLSKKNDSGIVISDQRGKKQPPNKTPETSVDFAKAHINSYPRVPSHWCRRDTKKEYLESILNREKIYDQYLLHCKDYNEKPVCKTLYKELLIQMNIGFHSPRKDQCWCYDFEKLSDEEKQVKEEKYLKHVKKKQEALAMKQRDAERAKSDETFLSGNFDLEAVLYSPLFFSKPLFYKRKLATFNSTFYNVGAKTGHCFMWPETEGQRGSNEIGTCFINFINVYVPRAVRHVSLFCDSCPGQNKNSVLACAMLCIINSHDTIDTCDLKFLEPGHTHMECDSMHSTIEHASEFAKIYLPTDWFNVVRLAKRNGTPYTVNIMNHNNFIDLKAYKATNFPNMITTTNGTRVKWQDITWVRCLKDKPNSLFFKYDFDESTPFQEIQTQSKKKSQRQSKISISHEDNEEIIHRDFHNPVYAAYKNTLPITTAKYNDLKTLCETGTIKNEYHHYYKTLPHATAKKEIVANRTQTEVNSSDDDLPLAAMRAKINRRKRSRN